MEQSVTINGKTYVISDTEWTTPARYCELFGIRHVAVVMNWIKRGIIPEEDYLVVPPLNGITLIRVKQYQEWYPLVTNEPDEQRPTPPRGGPKRNIAAD